MTFSILARDPQSGAIGGAAATGSLCVGGWVLRGDPRAGMSASQGRAPSTLWGDEVLTAMARGASAERAVANVTATDGGRAYRQLSALTVGGEGAVHSGAHNTAVIADRVFPGGVAAGNMLSTPAVIDALIDGYQTATGAFAARLLASLHAAQQAGGDSRGLASAALLVVSPDHAPLTLRIDCHADPLAALDTLYRLATTGAYARWCEGVPTLSAPERHGD